jgi:hypothetical protein
VPSKTFHFEADFEKVLEDLLEAYMVVSALAERLRGIVEAEGLDSLGADELIHGADQLLVRAIRRSGTEQTPPTPIRR